MALSSVIIVEQRIVYSIYYNSTLTLPYKEERGEGLCGWLLLVSEDGGREQETLYYYSETCIIYIVIR